MRFWLSASAVVFIACLVPSAQPIAASRGTVRPQRHAELTWPITKLWTGRGAGIGESVTQMTQLYGNPDSRSPSTKDAQPLKLLYYAFDSAGPDVPQGMQVLCTAEKNGQLGRVVQITLAASSL